MDKKSNLTLIGMPGAGKSVVGAIAAEKLSLQFVDTDDLIESSQDKTLQQIIDQSGLEVFRQIEEQVILDVDLESHVISTGGSVPYSERAMQHLKTISTVCFLFASFEEINRRIPNLATRGIAMRKDQTLLDLFHERQEIYQKYADLTVDTDGLSEQEAAEKIRMTLSSPGR